MGPTQQKPVSKTNNEQFPKIAHQVFSNRQIIKNGSEEQTILVKVAVPHQRQYLSWVEKLTKLGYHQALLLPKSHSFNKQGFCGLSGVADIYYENYPFLLSDQINNRECLGTKYFEQNQLWYLVLTLLSAANFFHSQKKKVGDIRPQNIFISEDGSVKVACIYSWPLERTNYDKSFEKNTTYISPEEVNEMNFSKSEPSSSLEYSQTFSIGLTLLDAATLSDSSELYKNNKNFNFQGLESKLKELQEKEQYSILLKGLICNLCNATPENRTSARQLYEWLSPFEQQINNFDNFETSQLPEKLRVQIQKSPSPPRSPPKTSVPPPLPIYNPPPQNNTYVGTHYSYQEKPSTTITTATNPPKVQFKSEVRQDVRQEVRQEPRYEAIQEPRQEYRQESRQETRQQPRYEQRHVEYNNKAPPVRVSVGGSSPPKTSNSGIGFSYQHQNQNSYPTTYGQPVRVTMPTSSYQPPQVRTTQIVMPSSSTAVESTYVANPNSRFSLQKIDEQLQQSRKLFPSS